MSENSESMIERVARAICNDMGINPDQIGGTWDGGSLPRDRPAWHIWDSTAIAAIDAMREPMRKQVLASCEIINNADEDAIKTVVEQWQVMISAALSQDEG